MDDLEEATASLIALEATLEEGTAAGNLERRRVVAGYNEDDCRVTLALRDWLEERRAELAELAGRLDEELPRACIARRGRGLTHWRLVRSDRKLSRSARLTVARRVRRWRGTPAAPRSPPGSSGLTAASASPARLP